ncbi:MAG: ABC transporter ATP-binding protein [Cellvibrionaceae bacterium]
MLKLRDVSKSFGRRQVLENINLTAKKGEIIGLLGPNGSGKSTIMRIIAGYYTADNGSVLIDGADSSENGSITRKKVGYLPERPPLYDALTVSQYLRFIADAKGLSSYDRSQQIQEVVKACRIEERFHQPIIQLSKGYRQRVGLAQMILGDPQLLLLDEPTNGLDPVQIIEAREMIRAQSQGRAVIYSSHIIQEVAALCSRVVILFNGRLVEVVRPNFIPGEKQHIKIHLITEKLKLLMKELTAIEGVEKVILASDSYDDIACGNTVIECITNTDSSINNKIVSSIIANGQLRSLQPIEFDLEGHFINHIHRMRKELEGVAV